MSYGMLRINKEAMYREYEAEMTIAAEQIATQMLDDMYYYRFGDRGQTKDFPNMRNWYEKEAPVLRQELGRNILNVTLKTSGFAIIDSYGTGTKADDTFWNEYKSSSMFNPLRTGKAIVGRNAGNYKGVLDGTSEGRLAGEITGFGGQPFGIKPSYAIQNVEAWYFGSFIPKHMKKASDAFFAKVRADPTKYFTYGKVGV